MKVKINAGAELDVLTREELASELERNRINWVNEVARGIRHRRFSAFGQAVGTALEIGPVAQIGPAAGFVWEVKRLTVVGLEDADVVTLYHSSVSDSAVIVPVLEGTQTLSEVLYPGETLVLSGTVTAERRIWVTGQVKEAPASLAWKL